ncbi:hypothetical protein G5S37_10410 [Roseimicrobium sp. ORNL1]|nr:hypothetical protein G5S37_10410 [Roseimicrobium sp. ORNL1]
MQYNAQKEAARNQEALTKYNYAVQAQNIRQQQALAEWSARAQAGQVEANAAIARQTAETNARMLEGQAQGELSRGVEQQRRTREDQLRVAALQRARFAKGGVAMAGSPVEVLAESARYMQLALSDAWYETNTKRDSLLWDAQMQRYGGEVSSAQYKMQASLLRAEGALAPVRARMQMREAEFHRLAGLNEASGMKSAATAGLVTGIGTTMLSLAGSYGTWGSLFGETAKGAGAAASTGAAMNASAKGTGTVLATKAKVTGFGFKF